MNKIRMGAKNQRSTLIFNITVQLKGHVWADLVTYLVQCELEGYERPVFKGKTKEATLNTCWRNNSIWGMREKLCKCDFSPDSINSEVLVRKSSLGSYTVADTERVRMETER